MDNGTAIGRRRLVRCEVSKVTEIKAVPGYPGYYADEKGNIYSCRKGQKMFPMKPTMPSKMQTSRYPSVTLSVVRKRKIIRRRVEIHSIVAETFLGPRPKGYIIGHRDDDSFNNHVDNLYYTTREQNQRDRLIHSKKGTALFEDQVLEIRRRHREDPEFDLHATAKEFDVSSVSVRNIVRYKTWKHLP